MLISEYVKSRARKRALSGTPLFENADDRRSLKLLDTRQQKTGVFVLTYEPV